MRDPDVVLRAQAAATALERAWRHWRVVHGLAANPAPAFSSYVGYSLEEPWGQPRVVLGLAAADAEQLTALLDRHDCVGPVHAEVVTRPAERELPARTGRNGVSGSGQMLVVPLHALPAPPAPPLPAPRLPAPSSPVQSLLAHPQRSRAVDDRDAPVFRQVTAAAQEAAAHGSARAVAAAVPADEWAHVVAADDQAIAGDPAAGARVDAPGPGLSAAPADRGARAEPPAPGVPGGSADGAAAVSARHAGRDADVVDGDDGWADEDWADDDDGVGDAAPDHADWDDAGSGDHATIADACEREVPPLPARVGPGPLTVAASAARAEAEARIKAAMLESRWSAGLEYPYSGGSFDVTAAGSGVTGPGHADLGCSDPRCDGRACDDQGRDGRGRDGQGCSDPRCAGRGGDGGCCDGQGCGAAKACGPADELAAGVSVGADDGLDQSGHDESGHDESGEEPQRPDHQGPGYARRARITRGYSIPRLSRGRRSGAVPGA